MAEPIMARCEGSGCPPAGGALRPWLVPICSMCGEQLVPTATGTMPEHERKDILAMIDRGDFD